MSSLSPPAFAANVHPARHLVRVLRGLCRSLAPVLALVAALPACDSLLVPDPHETSPAQIFDQVWGDVDRYYAHFSVSGVDWAAVRTRYRPLAQAASSDVALATAVSGMLGELHDPHVTLYTPWAQYQDMSGERPGAYDGNIASRYVTTSKTPSGSILYGRIGSDVGYVRIASFEGGDWGSEMDGVLAALPGVRALVLDIRCNGGGNDAIAKEVAGRFVDHEGIAEYVAYRSGPGHDDFGAPYPISIGPSGTHFTGKVALLTDRRIFSAAEQFVLFMRLAPQLTVVGDTTAGASGRPIVRELPNGWSYRLSTWIAYTAAHERFEGIGLPPDTVVRPLASDAAAGIDRPLQAAIARLK